MFPRRSALWPLVCLLCAPVLQEPDAVVKSVAAAPRHTISLSSVDTTPGEAPSGGVPAGEEDPYIEGQYLVAPPAGERLDDLAARVGATVIEAVGESGYGVLHASSLGALQAAGAEVAPLGRTVGAGRSLWGARTSASTTTTSTTQAVTRAPPSSWHLDRLGVPRDSLDWSAWTVAVLDSGVAYETSGRFVAAPGLSGVSFIAPLDLVEMDGHPNDDHQHGTHITSLIAGRGSYPGVVPGVSILPVKVLDSRNQGTEWALVEGIHHAIDEGADVINLSLSFPLGYLPSQALLDALSRAWDEDVVVVAASGNGSAREISWPAASRLSIAVGASKNTSYLSQTAYGNVSPKLDVLAPGGEIASDRDGDGWIDGILAETIDPADPARVGLWFYQGTSQSAALISGMAVRLLASGVDPHDIGPALQLGAGDYSPSSAWLLGTGARVPTLAKALDEGDEADHEDLYAGILPYLASWGTLVSPRARVTVIDEDGEPVEGAVVLGSIYSTGLIEYPLCTTDEDGSCDLASVELGSDVAWAFRVDAVVRDDVAERPSRAVFASDGAVALLEALSQAEGWDAIAVYWDAGEDPVLGEIAESWAIVDTGSGLLSSPLGLLFRPQATTATAGTLSIDLDGTGLLSSPLGTLSLKTLTFSPSGLLSSPLGTLSLRVVGISGSGLLSSPLGLHATSLYTGYVGGSGLLSSPLGLGYSSPLLLDRRTLLGSSVDGAVELLSPLFEGGVEGASAIIASGSMSTGLAASGSATQASGSLSAVPYTP